MDILRSCIGESREYLRIIDGESTNLKRRNDRVNASNIQMIFDVVMPSFRLFNPLIRSDSFVNALTVMCYICWNNVKKWTPTIYEDLSIIVMSKKY